MLPAEQAFVASSKIDNDSIVLSWKIADGYYLYRDKFSFKVKDSAVNLGMPQFPLGKIKHDPYFGDVETYRKHVSIRIPVSTTQTEPFLLAIKTQGCADVGVCYPPMKTELTINPEDLKAASHKQDIINRNTTLPLAEQDQIALALQNDTLAWTGLSFFGFGLLLAFTPCCLPMIPILSGIIVGQGNKISTSRAFTLSLIYVIASALTYTVFGILAGLFGSNLQAVFQSPWVIGSFSAIFVLLSFSMFGFYQLQLPATLQAKVSGFSNQQKSGGYIGVGVMGILSALIVGPCVAAPLAGALIYIGQTGDAVLGGVALFMMGLGMGAPLLVIGTSAGKLLPKAGTWMESVKIVFGVLLLAVAVWLLSRIIPASIS
ncbi:MAG: protein-disulfide reductase DsbD, partial [Methylococcales bacterium]|nr:protein-disulfide reductase DsbD [Methylococcales bacterium]